MTRAITTLQAMSHPAVMATINTLAEVADRLREENEQLRKPWVSLTEDEIYTLVAAGHAVATTRAVNELLKGKNT